MTASNAIVLHAELSLAAYATLVTGRPDEALLIDEGMEGQQAIDRVRQLRPGSLETEEQEQAVREFARRRAQTRHSKEPPP